MAEKSLITRAAADGAQLPDTPLAAGSAFLDQHAVVGAKDDWTWRQVHAASLVLAAQLRGASKICNLCSSRLGFLVTSLATWRGGREQLLPPSGGSAELMALLSSCKDAVVVADDQQELRRDWPEHVRTLLYVPETPSRRTDDGDLAWSPDWERRLVCLFTSGSTGKPEPHFKTLGQLARGASMLASRLEQEIDGGLGAVRQIICSVPPQHMFGLEACVMLSLVRGMPVVECRPLLPSDVSAAFEKYASGAVWITTPVHLRALVQAGEVVPYCRAVIASTMPLTPALAAEAEGLVRASILEIYGSTETGAVAMRRTAQTADWRLLHGVRIEPSAKGAIVWGTHFPSPQVLADEIESDGHGGFRLLGRHADLIKIAGRRGSLASLNVLLQDLPGMDDGVFYLPPTGSPTERLVLIYAGKRVDRASTMAWLRQRVDPIFLPRALVHVEHLPRSESGKLQRAALDAIFSAWRKAKAAQ